jgi:hypothetical protein
MAWIFGLAQALRNIERIKTMDNKTISYEDALNLLPEGDDIHTFVTPYGGMLLGADWRRAKILEELKNAEAIYISGDAAQAMNHGLAVPHDEHYLFIETVKEYRKKE